MSEVPPTRRRGRETRARLLRSTADLLQRTSYRELKVIDIARRAKTSPATFYQYFPDVESAIAVLAQDLSRQGEDLVAFIEASDWRASKAADTSAGLVDAFLDLWEKHGPLLRVVELATLEGDLRFQTIRTRLLNAVTIALRDVIEEHKRRRRHPVDVDPMAQAASVVSMLAHIASHRYGFEFWGIRTDAMRRSAADIVQLSVTGRRR